MRRERKEINKQLDELEQQEYMEIEMGDGAFQSQIIAAFTPDKVKLQAKLARSYGYTDYHEMLIDQINKEMQSKTSLLHIVYDNSYSPW